MYEPFYVKRIGPRGPDTHEHLFCVAARGNHELVRTADSAPYAPINDRADELNAVWARYLRGW